MPSCAAKGGPRERRAAPVFPGVVGAGGGHSRWLRRSLADVARLPHRVQSLCHVAVLLCRSGRRLRPDADACGRSAQSFDWRAGRPRRHCGRRPDGEVRGSDCARRRHRAPDRRFVRICERRADRPHRHQRLHHYARDRLGLCRPQSRHHRIDPLLQSTCRLRRLRHSAFLRPALPVAAAPCRRGAARLIPRAHRAWTIFTGRRRQPLRRRTIRSSARPDHCPRSYAFRPARRRGRGACGRPTRLGAADDRRRLAHHFVRRADHRRRRADRRTYFRRRHVACRRADRAHRERHGAGAASTPIGSSSCLAL